MWAWNDLKKRVSVGLGDDNDVKETAQQQTNQTNDKQTEQKQALSPSAIPYINSSAWYESSAYKSLFASKTLKSSQWITQGIDRYLDSNYNQYDDTNLSQLIHKLPDQHKYSNVVQDALNIFNDWRQWKNLKKNTGGTYNEWKLSSSEKFKLDSYNDTHLNCYWNNISDSSISATKGEMILPYSTPIICGIIENSQHECSYEEYSDTIYEIEQLSQHCGLFYAQTKTPMFMAERDVFGVGFVYILPNAEVITGCRSVHDSAAYQDVINGFQDKDKSQEYVRAFYTLDLYHLRPWYERNSNYTKVTYYSHLDLKGTIPNWIINGMISDTPKIILSLKKYIDANVKLLSRPGQIHIPLNMLQYVGIYVDPKLYKVRGEREVQPNDKTLQFSFEDCDLSDAEMKHEKGNDLEFVSVGSKSVSMRYKQRETGSYYDIETPISTPDLQKAQKDMNPNDEEKINEDILNIADDDIYGNKDSDLGADFEEDEVREMQRMKSGVDDIDDMLFAFDRNAVDEYKEDVVVNEVENKESESVGDNVVDNVRNVNEEFKQKVNDNDVVGIVQEVGNEDDIKQRQGDRESFDESEVGNQQGNDEEKSTNT